MMCYYLNVQFQGQRVNGTDIVRFIKARRIRLLANIQRMNPLRMVKIILKWKPVGNRRTGTPSIRWPDDVCQDMKVMKVKNWKELELNRNPGDCLVEKVKPTNGCKAIGRRSRRKSLLTQRYVAFQTAVFLNC
jgi:hypothetical protein